MPRLIELNIQLFAHKKGQGSTKNGRDSISKIFCAVFITILINRQPR